VSTKSVIVQQAYRFALDPTPTQERAFASHAGGARYAFNWGIACIAAALDARAAEKEAGREPTTNVPSHFDLCKRWTAFKDDPSNGLHWVGENFSGTYQAALRDAAGAWRAFFDARNGKRQGKVGRPRFKKKGRSRESFQVHNDSLKVVDAHHIQLPRIGTVRTHEPTRKLLRRIRKDARSGAHVAGVLREARKSAGLDIDAALGRLNTHVAACARQEDREPKRAEMWSRSRLTGIERLGQTTSDRINDLCDVYGVSKEIRSSLLALMTQTRIVRGSVSRGTSGRWHVSLTVEIPREIRTGPSARQQAGGTVGVDLGVRSLVVLSDGTEVPRPRHLDQRMEKLRRAQRAMSRCVDGSRRRESVRRRLGRTHARVASLRLDSTHKLTSHLVHTYERIGVEGWDIRKTMQDGSRDLPKRLRADRNRALADANLGELRWQLQSKAAWYGVTVVVAEPHGATGRTCSECGAVKTKPLPPAEEQFRCLFCGYTASRRLNTARR
jgi:putative transposase